MYKMNCSKNAVNGSRRQNLSMNIYTNANNSMNRELSNKAMAEKSESPENAVFSGLFGVPGRIRTSGLQSRSRQNAEAKNVLNI